MPERIFAAIDNGVITNTFVADDSFAASIRDNHDDVVEITGVVPQPGINWTVHPDGYRPLQPYESWVWEEDRYVAPVPKPIEDGLWQWDENTLSWIQVNE